MKNIIKVGIVALVAVIGFTFGACADSTGGGNDTDAFTGTWISGGEVKITAGKGSWTLSNGYDNDWIDYMKGTYTVSGNTGNITTTHGNTNESGGVTWTAYASLPAKMKEYMPQTMTGTLNGNTYTVNGLVFTKQTGGEETGGTFTLTGIPAEYNGKYAILVTSTPAGSHPSGVLGYWVFGAQSANILTDTITAVPISGESVSFPMWIDNGTRYSGSGTFISTINIINSARLTGDPLGGSFAQLDFINDITFTNGSATRTWSSGYLSQRE